METNLVVFQIVGWVCIVSILLLLVYHSLRNKSETTEQKIQLTITTFNMLAYVAHILLTLYMTKHFGLIISIYYMGRTWFYCQLIMQIHQAFADSAFGYNAKFIIFPLISICGLEIIGLTLLNMLHNDSILISMSVFLFIDVTIMILCFILYSKPLKYMYQNSAKNFNYGVDQVETDKGTFKRVNTMKFMINKLAIVQIITTLITVISLILYYMNVNQFIFLHYNDYIVETIQLSLIFLGNVVNCLLPLFLSMKYASLYFQCCGPCHMASDCFIYEKRDMISFINFITNTK
eukprot:189154_1